MRTDEFFEIIGDIDDEKIDEAVTFEKKTGGKAFIKWGALAACFVIVTVLSLQLQKKENMNNAGDIVVENPPDNIFSEEVTVPVPQTETETVTEADDIIQDEAQYKSGSEETYQYGTDTEITDSAFREKSAEDTDNAFVEESIEENGDSAVADTAPASGGGGGSASSSMYKEAVDVDSLSKTAEEFFGGAYIDENGNYVVVITNDTPENRSAIAQSLKINVNDAVFKKGEYTLAYLTQLQDKISTAMANGEIPFVVTSAVMETTNRIEVGVTTDNEAELDKVRQMDSLGGAIVFEYTSESFDTKQ